MIEPDKVIIRGFGAQDRGRVRAIGCATVFPGIPRKDVFSDDEILADALTSSYTDYEPQSCLVAEVNGRVVGYLIGSKDSQALSRRSRKAILPFVSRALLRGVFFKPVNLKFIFQCLKSSLKGEFRMPDFSKSFPAALHINIEEGCRGKGIGAALIKRYLGYLAENKVRGVHFGTLSDKAKDFFVKMGFEVLFRGERSYLRVYSGRMINFYVLGRML